MSNLRRPAVMMLTPKQYAKKYDVHYNTVYRWIRLALVNYERQELPQRHRYLIDAYQQPPIIKPGPHRQKED